MAEQKSVFTAALLSAGIVLAVALPAGYLALQSLPATRGDDAAAAARTVILELKTEALDEIAAAGTKAREEVAALREQDARQRAMAFKELSDAVAELRGGQEKLVSRLEELAKPTASAQAVAPPAPPGQRPDAFNQTILFPLAKSEGDEIDKQVRTAIAEITTHIAGGACRVNVLGFSDTLGGDVSNLELSRKRAVHVAAMVKAAGLPVGKVEGWGERWLNVHTLDGVENERNRRVVLETVCEGRRGGNSRDVGT